MIRAGGALKCIDDNRNIQLRNGRLVGGGKLLIEEDAPVTSATAGFLKLGVARP